MRVFLTNTDLKTDAGKQLLALALRISVDGKISLDEIKELRRWLRANQSSVEIMSVAYLNDIMHRITLDRVIDRDELNELQLAIERVIPKAHRAPVIEARKKIEDIRKKKRRERQILEEAQRQKEIEKERRSQLPPKERIWHTFSKIVGVTFPNDDGSERQDIIRRCSLHEQLHFKRDSDNEYCSFAVKILRLNGEQLGHVTDRLTEDVCYEMENGYRVVGFITDLTGGIPSKPTRGVNYALFFFKNDVTLPELQSYVETTLANRT